MSQGVIINQPGYGGQMPMQTVPVAAPMNPIPGCPPGLEYITQLDTILVYQKIEMLEVLTGFECKNRYQILNKEEQQIYFCKEESTFFQRCCCGPSRGFVFTITDNNNQVVLRVKREFACCKGCTCWCGDSCWYYASIEDAHGTLLGFISNLNYCCKPSLGVFDTSKNLVARMDGPCCACQAVCCTADVDFPVVELNKDGANIGKIAKTWPGFVQDTFTKADNFRITFPINLDPKKKALLLGATFVLDLVVFEPQKQNNSGGGS